jgi:hypothetical protein
VDAHNENNGVPARFERVTVYMGQCAVLEEDVRDS